MNTLKNISVIILLLTSITNIGTAQDLYTLERTLEIAYENSPSIRQSKLSLTRSRESLNAQQASLKSKFTFDVDPITYNNSRRFNEDLSRWITSEKIGSSSSFSVVQPIKATDGKISLINRLSWQNNDNQSNNIAVSDFTNNLVLNFDQPLFTYNKTKQDLRKLELNLENTLLSYAIQKLNIEKQVSQQFYQVYQRQKSLIISKEEFANQQKTYEIIKNKVDAGLAAKDEFWQAELNLANARSSVYNAEVSLENAKDQLKQSIGIRLSENIDVITNVEVIPIDVEMDDALNYALKQRMELQQREIDIQNAEFSLIEVKERDDFNGSVGLSIGLMGINNNIGNIYETPTGNQDVGLSFSIPIFDWGARKSRIKASEASLEITKLDFEDEKISIELNIRQVYRNLKNLINQIEIAKKSVENAQLTYELNVEKYENGDLTSMDLSLYQNQLSSKKNELTNSLISYKLELLNLKIQTLWDFETNKSIVPSEYSPEFSN